MWELKRVLYFGIVSVPVCLIRPWSQYGVFTLSDTETNKLTQNPMWICVGVCLYAVWTPPHNSIQSTFYQSFYCSWSWAVWTRQCSDYNIILHNPFSFISLCRSWCRTVWTHSSSDSEDSTLVLPGRFQSCSPGPTSDWPAGRSGPSPPPPVCSTWGSSSSAPSSVKWKCQQIQVMNSSTKSFDGRLLYYEISITQW